ncbi:hypothetical protein MRX96_031557 [Rhipicephalus microplus]
MHDRDQRSRSRLATLTLPTVWATHGSLQRLRLWRLALSPDDDKEMQILWTQGGRLRLVLSASSASLPNGD